MPDFNPLVWLITIALILLALVATLGAFTMMGKLFWGEFVEKADIRMSQFWWKDVRLGAVHAVGMLVLAKLGEGRPLLHIVALLWIALIAACLWLALPALVQRAHPSRDPLKGALCAVWACALPYFGQALLVVLLCGCYAAGLSVLLDSRKKNQPEKNPEFAPESL